MSGTPTERSVAVYVRDLMFRAKIEVHAARLGFRTVPAIPASCAVVALGNPQQVVLVRRLCEAGTPVLAFGPHVDAASLRAAREAGATAVPNSRLDAELAAFLATLHASGAPGTPDRPTS